ncbi:hypothetical protein SAMN04488003_11713 [Loktanella fryxellensis]|uniref:Uncharacterized protein n=1 Tax=Loktanella fryxellensis TaxID=245187 RepID=A0A1H8GNW8_9RHOB|nr:hypothetical protein SAMN04488003_11713 [Loktanella fryxellensis]
MTGAGMPVPQRPLPMRSAVYTAVADTAPPAAKPAGGLHWSIASQTPGARDAILFDHDPCASLAPWPLRAIRRTGTRPDPAGQT